MAVRVAVTGSSGFVGGRIANRLRAAGHSVLAYGRRPARELSTPQADYTAWDIATTAIDAPPVDAVVHCAALVGDWGPDSAYDTVNVEGTRNVARSFGCTTRMVHVSTSSVYSDHVTKVRVTETASSGDCRHSAYGRSKARAEAVVRESWPTAVILRPHIVYGPGDTTLLPRLLASRRLGLLALPGSGRTLLSVTHVDNLALAVECALRDGSGGGVFNVSDAETVSVDALLHTVFARLGVAVRLAHIPRAVAWGAARLLEHVWPSTGGRRGPPLTRYVVGQLADEHTLDITRARTVLGYVPRWTYRDGPLDMSTG